MKVLTTILLAGSLAFAWTSCSNSNAQGRYIDLNTGKPVELIKDEKTGLMVNAETHEPVRIYIDTKSNDTIWGKSGKVINGYVEKGDGDVYLYMNPNDGDSDYKIKHDGPGYKEKVGDDYKKKVEDDGDYKIKDGDKKIKVDVEKGEVKVKRD